ncbi:conserved protein, unknown function [Hepatocystis sp. ex Piliocolobus tephrosceles]|nr:conserved protein, unknown function [Hepatocystis sp. ex Piliocolobus tephrosceles]
MCHSPLVYDVDKLNYTKKNGVKKKIDKEDYFKDFNLCSSDDENDIKLYFNNSIINTMKKKKKYEYSKRYNKEMKFCKYNNNNNKIYYKIHPCVFLDYDQTVLNSSIKMSSFSLTDDGGGDDGGGDDDGDGNNIRKEKETTKKKNHFNNIMNKNEKLIAQRREKNDNLLNMIVLKNINCIYFLFDRDNTGYINQKYACYVIRMIYENNFDFFIKHIKLNAKYINQKIYNNTLDNNKYSSNNKINSIKETLKLCTKLLSSFLLTILLEISTFYGKKYDFIEKGFFFTTLNRCIQTTNYTDNKYNNLYLSLKYHKNIITKFYNYVYYLKTWDDENKEKTLKNNKKQKEFKNIYFMNNNIINAGLNTHIKYFKAKAKKKLEQIKVDVDKEEMKECTFSCKTNERPFYLLKNKIDKNLSQIMSTKSGKETCVPLRIIYDIDDTVERSLYTPFA